MARKESGGELPKLSWMTMTNERTDEDRPALQRFSQALNSETRRIILNKIYREAKTGAQIADEIGISRASISDHLKILREAGIIREPEMEGADKRYVVEKYYTVNFPVVLGKDRELLDGLAREIGQKMAKVIEGHMERIRETFSRTTAAEKGWSLADVYPYIQSRIREAEAEASGRKQGIPSWTFAEEPWCMIGFEYTEKQMSDARERIEKMRKNMAER